MARILLSVVLMGGLLAACATSTPYQPAGESGSFGYAEQRIESDRYLVTFSGNSLTDRDTVETFLLFRAAELTLEQGYDYFQVVRRDTEIDRRYSGTAFGASRFSVGYRYFHPRFGWYGPYDPFYNDIDIREITRYEARAEILLGRGAAPGAGDVFDAREVVQNLGPRVAPPPTG